MKTNMEKIKILGTQMNESGTPLVSLFIPLKATYMAPSSMLNSLLQTANNILSRDGFAPIKIIQPDWKFWMAEDTQSIGLYHAEGVTTIIPLNVLMEPRVIVAESFHVKPIIASTGNAGEALLLTFHTRGCSLTRVTASSSILLETYVPANYDLNDRWLEQLSRQHLRDFVEYMISEVSAVKSQQTKLLIIEGASADVLKRNDLWAKINLPVHILGRVTPAQEAQSGVDEARTALLERQREVIKSNIRGALASQDSGKEKHERIEEIAKLILHRKVSKIFVSLDDLVFGELHPTTGEVKVHRAQKNAKDDDLLDDLAELALRNGVDVHVIPRDLFPEDQTILYA